MHLNPWEISTICIRVCRMQVCGPYVLDFIEMVTCIYSITQEEWNETTVCLKPNSCWISLHVLTFCGPSK